MSNAFPSQDPTSSNHQRNTRDLIINGMPTIVNCRKSEDILEKIIPYAQEEEMGIIAANGFVSHVELLNPQGDTISIHRDLRIYSLEGIIVYPKKNGKNPAGWANAVLCTRESDYIGGPVKSLIAKSNVQVLLCAVGDTDLKFKRVGHEEEEYTNFAALMDRYYTPTQAMDMIFDYTMQKLNEP